MNEVVESIEFRLVLTPEDPLFQPFLKIKNSLGVKSNSEVARFVLTQISKIPISTLILDIKSEAPALNKKDPQEEEN